ncbi:MAG: flagellar FliJ family protein [Pirellulales bacterium]
MNSPFRLASILRWREVERDSRRQEWVEACDREAELRVSAQRLWEEIQAEQSRRRAALDAGAVSIDELQTRHRYELALREELDSLQQARDEAARQRELRQGQLAEAEQALKALERLRQQHSDQLASDLRRREQLNCDESAARQAVSSRA